MLFYVRRKTRLNRLRTAHLSGIPPTTTNQTRYCCPKRSTASQRSTEFNPCARGRGTFKFHVVLLNCMRNGLNLSIRPQIRSRKSVKNWAWTIERRNPRANRSELTHPEGNKYFHCKLIAALIYISSRGSLALPFFLCHS